jgi:alkylation response protein AidB-like acyl-CoA dehydrogenase
MIETLSDEETMLVDTVRAFIDRDVKPSVREVEHANSYPEAWIEQMKRIGIYGLAVPEEFGGTPVSMPCYVEVTQELARGWMSLAGAMGGHTVVAKLITLFGTAEQKQKYLPGMATGAVRATMALTEPGGGSDLQAMTTTARSDGDELVINGSKTWISNARRSGLIALLCKTDATATPRHSGISILLVEHGQGLTVSRDLPKLGYKGVETCELSFDDCRVPASAVLGGLPGKGFGQMMKGLETGRIQVAARALGVATAALEDALAYSQQRESFGQPIWKHQSVGNYLADMATKLTAARQLTRFAAEKFDSGERCDMEAGMAKLFASEVAMEVALNAVRIHGGYGYSTEYDVERYFRDAPLMIVGEGTNEIQRTTGFAWWDLASGGGTDVKVTVFGATGQIGQHVVKVLLTDGHDVTTYVRNPGKLQDVDPRLEVVAGELSDLKRVREAVHGRRR